MGEWQPIETAPKDGRWFLAWGPESTVPMPVMWDVQGRWAGWVGFDYDTYDIEGDTHWHPLPDPPK